MEPKPFPVILHVRVPAILDGRDHQRYLERKFRDLEVRLCPPPTLIGTDIPVGYGLVRTRIHGWHVVEVRGEIPSRHHILHLHQHELVEDMMDEALEELRRAERASARADAPRPEDLLDDENITAGGPAPSRLMIYAVTVADFLLTPFSLLGRGLRRLRRWFVREYG